MIGNNYKVHKDNLIDIFEGYKVNRKNFGENDGIDLELLKGRIQNLKDGKFTLAVAGEVKAGKSTFINALLGVELLPSDVLQATNAIVEIFKSIESYLKVEYANGKKVEIYDDLSTPDVNEAKEALHKVCKLSDKYRDIPTTLLDLYIINNENKAEVNDEFIKKLEEKTSKKYSSKKDKIREYLDKRRVEEIPVKIEFGHPLKWEFDELRIVDSPGVNAIGGIQNVSFSYFEEANAILFVHQIKPIESQSFVEFVNSVITNRSKETLFLVLSHAGLYPNSEVKRLYNEAKSIFEDSIPPERIYPVDSLLEIIKNDLNKGKHQEEIEDESEQKSDILLKFEKKAEKQNKSLVEIINEGSRFENMYNAIDEFSMNAPKLQLKQILKTIKDGYEQQEKIYSENIELLNKKKRNPQEFENEIIRISEALERYKNLIGKTKENISKEYSGSGSEYQKQIDKLKEQYPKLITSAKNFEMTRKRFSDGLNEVKDLFNKFSQALTNDINEKLQRIAKPFEDEERITIPKIDLKSIEEATKKESYKKKPICESRKVDFWDVIGLGIPRIFRKKEIVIGEEKIYDETKHLLVFKRKCNRIFSDIINDSKNQFNEFSVKYLQLFSKKIKSIIQERKKALKNLKDKQESNLEIQRELKELKQKKSQLPSELKRTKELAEELS